MKKLAAVLMIAGAALVAGNSIVSAQQGPYGPGPTGGVSSSTVVIGGTFTAIVSGCAVPSDWTFSFQGQTRANVPCTASGGGAFLLGFLAAAPTGTASATFTAPTTPGAYSGTAVSGATSVTFSITVVQDTGTTTTPSGGIPATGSNSTGPTMLIAVVLLTVGAGMFAVAHLRRRRVATS